MGFWEEDDRDQLFFSPRDLKGTCSLPFICLSIYFYCAEIYIYVTFTILVIFRCLVQTLSAFRLLYSHPHLLSAKLFHLPH